MAQGGLGNHLKYLKRRSLQQANGLPDSTLLERYVHTRDKAAFELLVWRYGALVLNTCRRLLRNEHDIDDAFHATFATLACKARGIHGQNSVAPWLYKVAYRAALAARTRSNRHVTLPRELEPQAERDDELFWRDLREALDGEVSRLPTKYRDAFVLCYLQGLTHCEAAARLGCPEGTIHSRLATAKVRLRDRLERRGVTLSGTGMALDFATRHAAVAPTVALIQTTLTTVAAVTGISVDGIATSTSAINLSRGVLFTMWIQSLALPGLVTVIIGLAGVGFLGMQSKTKEPTAGGEDAKLVVRSSNKPETANDEKKKDSEGQKEKPKATDDAKALSEIEKLARIIEKLRDARFEKQRALAEFAAQQSKELLEVESNFRMAQQESLRSLSRGKKQLAALEDEEISLSRELRKRRAETVGMKMLPGDIEHLSTQLSEVHKLMEQESARIENFQKRAWALEKKARVEKEEVQGRSQHQEARLQQDLSDNDRLLEKCEQRLQILDLSQQFPNPNNAIGTTLINSEWKRLETKLDQILQELADLKKQHAKP
ncbi:hypothetical protein BH10PLA2_BH10PLA2_29690 [soil metagenome]